MKTMSRLPRGVKILIGSALGRNIPRIFAEEFTGWSITEQDRQNLLRGNDIQETWERVLDTATWKDDRGHSWILVHDEDLMAVSDELLNDADYEEFWGEKRGETHGC